jgi:hypothetical protein
VSGVAFDAIAETFSVVFATGPFAAVLGRDRDGRVELARVELALPRELLFRPREVRARVFPRLELLERLPVVVLLELVLRLVVDRVV